MSNIRDYLTFEGGFVQAELEAFEEIQSRACQLALLEKRIEARNAWEAKGKTIPEGLTFDG
jgi:hypothetical protein